MKKFIRRVVVVYTFTNMFNIGPHKRQLPYHVYSCTQPVVTYTFG